MNYDSSNEGIGSTDFKWPSWKSGAQWSLTVISFILGIIVFFYPDIEKENYERFRLIIGSVLLASAILIPTATWFLKTFRVALLRISICPLLFEQKIRLTNELNDMKRIIFEMNRKEIDRCGFELLGARFDRGSLFIAIKKRPTPELIVGALLVVFHKDDGMPMGVFEVTEARTNEYYAKGINNVDPVWSSFVLEKGESHFIPNMIAILKQKE